MSAPLELYAFPFVSEPTGQLCPGMTMRDWFAGQALTGMLGGSGRLQEANVFADAAYHVADAMLLAREQQS